MFKKRGSKKASLRPSRPFTRAFLIGLLISGALYGTVHRKEIERRVDAVAKTAELESQLATTQAQIDEHNSGLALKPAELTSLISPIEQLLPNASSPGPAISSVQQLASSRNVNIENISFTDAFTDAGGGLESTTISFQASGSGAAILGFLDALGEYPQLITATIPSISLGEGDTSVQVGLTVWASTSPEWRNGR